MSAFGDSEIDDAFHQSRRPKIVDGRQRVFPLGTLIARAGLRISNR